MSYGQLIFQIREALLTESYSLNPENPLLDLSGLPRFAEIEADQIESALDAALAQSRAKI